MNTLLNFFANKRVFITGHTGFKGSWLSLWLTKLGAQVCGYSLEPNTVPALYNVLNLKTRIYKSIIGNILDYTNLEQAINDFKPEIIFHLAAQPLVRLSYLKPYLTYETNVIGTLNVLEVARKCSSVKALINVTTDKCYENREVKTGYHEDDPMGGYDLYSSSKACSEILSSSYRRSFLKNANSLSLATARAGNVIGGGDWALDRIIPDAVKTANENRPLELRKPNAIRPWQFVLEPLSGYLLLGVKLLQEGHKYATCFNFGPNDNNVLSVFDVASSFYANYGKGQIVIQEDDSLHESGMLLLNIKKAQQILNWTPSYTVAQAIVNTASWYQHFYQQDCDMYEYSLKQINDYEACLKWNLI